MRPFLVISSYAHSHSPCQSIPQFELLLDCLYKQEVRLVIQIVILRIFLNQFLCRIRLNHLNDSQSVISKCIYNSREHSVISLYALYKPSRFLQSFYTIIGNIGMNFYTVLIPCPSVACPRITGGNNNSAGLGGIGPDNMRSQFSL